MSRIKEPSIEELQLRIDELEKSHNTYSEVIDTFTNGYVMDLISSNIKTIKIETLQNWFSNPDKYMENISNLLTYYYITNGDINNLYNMIFTLPRLDYKIVCYEKTDTYEKDMIKIKKALDKKAIHFMDSECERSCRDVVPTCKDTLYLPVFIQPQDVVPKEQLVSEEEINAAWVGRLDSDKIFSLLNILHNFENYKTNKKKKFHIIGIGNSEHLIDISKYPSVEIIKTGKLVYEELDKYLLNHVDVMFGMGTSLLEAAKLGIPCALVKILEKESLSDDYISLFNLDKYILGYTDDDIVKHMKKDRMQDILDGIINNKSEYIAKTTEYLSRYHTIQASAYRFIHNIGLSGLSFAEYDHYGKKRISLKRKIKTCLYKLMVVFVKILPIMPNTLCDKLSKKIRKYS